MTQEEIMIFDYLVIIETLFNKYKGYYNIETYPTTFKKKEEGSYKDDFNKDFKDMMKEYNIKHFNGILDYCEIYVLMNSFHPLISKTLSYYMYVNDVNMNEDTFILYLKDKYYLPSMKLKLLKIIANS
jgi:hypothetical protein